MQESEEPATIDDLLALIRDMLEDDDLSIHEFARLDRWLAANPQLADQWPVTEIADGLKRIAADKLVEPQELQLLGGALKRIAKS